MTACEELGAAGPWPLGAIETPAIGELCADPEEAPEPKMSASWDGMAALFKD